MTNDTFPVVIIGGGLAGLVAGVHLASKGIPALILESDALWAGGRLAGGAVETFTYAGREWAFKTEHGVHGLWGGYVNLKATLERFTDTHPLPSHGEEWINRWGKEVRRLEAGNAIRSKWIPAPFHYLQLLFNPRIWSTISPWDFLSLPGILNSIFLTLAIDPIREKKAWDGLTMDTYFLGWTPNLKATFKGIGVNLLAAADEKISLAGFIAGMRFYTMLRRDSWEMSYFPQDAGTSVIQPLIDKIREHGGQILQGYSAQSLHKTTDGWRVIAQDNPENITRSFHAQQLILAMNAPATQRLLMNSSDTRSQAEGIIFPEGLYSSVVRMWFSKAPTDGVQGGMLTGDFVPDNFFWLHRLYPDYALWHTETGGSVLEMHIYPKAQHAQLPDANLLILATSEAYTAFPELRGSFVYGAVRRNSKVHTQFRVPTESSLHVKTPYENVFACGDWIGHDTPSLWMERATTTAIAAANEVLATHSQPLYDILYPPTPEMSVQVLGWFLSKLRRFVAWIVRGLRWRG
jgi:carotenoid phi-ring synthase / carotenoid chi-ring synthase